MKNKKQLEKKYVDELKDEYDRIGEIRANSYIYNCWLLICRISCIIFYSVQIRIDNHKITKIKNYEQQGY